ncbi:MAG: Alpha/beta hydrolase family protein [Syntrophorhabdaceae bacterium PtaU1.Bin034]|nr:MAG: Alpha/beta hydrolase family protein [Syntrophorhabdaceae bacterium PtaU1.Bin034]
MSTKRVVIEADERLEGVLQEGTGEGGVVICHPHPLYGGSMWSNVVEAIEEGFSEAGFTTLKFNFRGVGSSTGHYDDGVGETDDLLAARRFLEERIGKDTPLVLAGYSFGAWICSRALAHIEHQKEVFIVALPFSAYSPEGLRTFPGKIYLVGGSLDDISPLKDLLAFYEELKTEKYLKVVTTTHFFGGKEREIAGFIIENFGKTKG